MTRYGMAIDLKRCIGCHTCSVACKMANNLPKDVMYNRVLNDGAVGLDTASGQFPNNAMKWLPMQCQHCDNPACVDVCPTGASQKREDGIVWIDGEMCIGCKSCITACPYEGVRTFMDGEPEYYIDMAVGEFDAPVHKDGIVEKCTFCFNLIDRGEVPACMQLCPGRARFWGDLDDPESEVSKYIAERGGSVLQAEDGTEPKVYYIQ